MPSKRLSTERLKHDRENLLAMLEEYRGEDCPPLHEFRNQKRCRKPRGAACHDRRNDRGCRWYVKRGSPSRRQKEPQCRRLRWLETDAALMAGMGRKLSRQLWVESCHSMDASLPLHISNSSRDNRVKSAKLERLQ